MQVIKKGLEPRLLGRTGTAARELNQLVLRNLAGRPLAEDARGRAVERVRRGASCGSSTGRATA
ncbi:MAG: hypothetical protein FJ314_06580 [SAR202 cluster bacterium]|nr:hypothetical protein [SAR202 cluster bacterium]